MTRNLETRLVAALTGDPPAAKLAILIGETEEAVLQAKAAAEAEREKALDPIRCPEPDTAREAIASADFTVARLRALLPRLEDRFARVAAAEERAEWKARSQVPLAVFTAASAPSPYAGADWFEGQRARAASDRAEAARAARYYAQEKREREDRENRRRLR